MNATRWERLQQIVESAADLNAGRRSAWLIQICDGDSGLEEQARRMLMAYSTDDTGIERAIAGGVAAASQQTTIEEIVPGDLLGFYRVVRKLATGGMGSVYLAERRDEHFQESVAIKVVHTSAHLRSSLSKRFRLERQVLAAIRHPNIASLLDGGVTEAGLPYLVMEYIDGEDLLRYVQAHQLSEHAVLELFRTVCAAVQHAHQNLVVHRDLKPGNVLVTRDGQPKLLDFGIAKLLSDTVAPALATETMATDRLLTLQYASPEQITGGAITTATDVYGLGATLYELLTGEPPFPVDRASLAEAQQLICHTAPVPPSVRGEQANGSRRRLPAAKRALTDLDRILLKSLHKRPERRYASAAELSDDLRRYLTGFPVQASPDSVAYRASRFLRRNALAVSLASAALITVFVLLALLSVQTRRARREAASADAVAAYLTGLFDQAQPDVTHGRKVSARELLDHGTAELGSSWKGEPLVKARLLSALGRIYYQLGEPAQADDLLGQAAGIYTEHRNADLAEVADNSTTMGNVALERGDLQRAEQQYRRALDITTRVQGRQSSAAAELLDDLGLVQNQRGDYDDAARNLQEAAEIHTRLQGLLGRDTLGDKHNLESVYSSMGQYHRAEVLLREVMQADRQSRTSDAKTLTASDLGNMAHLLDRQGRLHEAYPLLLQSVDAHRALFGNTHPRLVMPLLQLGWYQRQMGDLTAAEQNTQDALDIAKKADGDASTRTAYAEDYLGLVRLDGGRLEEARDLFQQAQQTREAKHAAPSIQAQSFDHLALVDLAQGHAEAALAGFNTSRELRHHAFQHPTDWLAMSDLQCAEAELALGRVSDAERDNTEARAILLSTFGTAAHPLTAEALRQQGLIAARKGDAIQAHDLLAQALAMQRRIYDNDTAPEIQKTRRLLASSLK